jgi:DNA (cytosine-5)-methyltransferase 1
MLLQRGVLFVITKKYSVVSFFAGVGGIEYGFEKAGGFETIWANEIDKHAAITYRKNFKHCLVNCDVKEIENSDVPIADVFVGGFPCQAFSIAGYRKGFEDDRGNLFFEILKFIKTHTPRIVFLENVKNLVSHDNGNTYRVIKEALETYGYKVKKAVLNAKEYGNVPQNRERIYIIAFLNHNDYRNFDFDDLDTIPLTKDIKSILDSNVDEIFYYDSKNSAIYDRIIEDINVENIAYQWRRKYVRVNKSGVIPTLTANMGMGGHNVPIIYIDGRIRKLTPRECFRAQGYGDEFELPNISNSHLYKQAGNSVVVPVIQRIAEGIYDALTLTDASEVDN